jgi:hypothetical protein
MGLGPYGRRPKGRIRGGGDGGIRTLGGEFSPRRFSKPLVSATHPRLRRSSSQRAIARVGGGINKLILVVAIAATGAELHPGAYSTRFAAHLIAGRADKDSSRFELSLDHGIIAMSYVHALRLVALPALTGLLLSVAAATSGAQAQVRTVDPNSALGGPATAANTAKPATAPVPTGGGSAENLDQDLVKPDAPAAPASAQTTPTADASAAPVVVAGTAGTFRKDDLIGAAEGVFGKGAQGLGELLEKILKDQGEPNGYIAGREASGAFVIGLRYGSGTLTHSVEGQRPVYWTGPSLGFDVGGDATKVFVLVYNLYDSQDLYKRFAQVEGRAYFVGGLSATYLRRGDVALIPVRLGVGVRLGANIGYMKFSEKSRWLPF